MNISGVSNSESLYNLIKLTMTQSVSSTTLDEISGSTRGEGPQGPDSARFSKMSEMLSNLEQLKASDPEKFKALMTEYSEKLSKAAEEQGGFEAKMLNELAAKFADVANGGDISQLAPPKPPPYPGGGNGMQGIMAGGEDQASDAESTTQQTKNLLQRPPQGSDSLRDILDSLFSELGEAIKS